MEAEHQPETVPMESKLKHLELIQSVINRMASNSFRLKEWSVVLVSAILFLAARENSGEAALIGLVPALVFWGLDAYFLRQERLYRTLYDQVRDAGATRDRFLDERRHLEREEADVGQLALLNNAASLLSRSRCSHCVNFNNSPATGGSSEWPVESSSASSMSTMYLAPT